MPDLLPVARFPLPENWEVEGTICVIVPIPDDQEYLGVLLGLLDMLKWSRNFDRDSSAAGAATVSRTWQAALESQPIKIGDCYRMVLRQNSDDPCLLEQSQDGGETWTLAFDYALCSNVITVRAPYPESETGASDAAAASMRNVFEALTNMVDCEASRESYIAAATAYLRTFDASYANPAALGAIYDAFCALDESDQTLWKSDCPFDEHKDDLEACADASGLYDWLNCGAETINNWLDDTGEAIMDALNQAAAALSPNGWQNTAGGGAGGGGSFGSSGETIVYDFLTSDEGFTTIALDYYGGPSGEWVDGLGWACHIHDTGSGYALNIALADVIPSGRHITHAEMVFTQDYGGAATTVYFTTYPLVPSYETMVDGSGTYTGEQTPSNDGDWDTRGTSVFVHHFAGPTDFYLKSLTIVLSC